MIDRRLFVHATEPYLSDFLSLVHDEGRHWTWGGKVNPSGYGIFDVDRKTIGAHRLAFEWANGPLFSWLETDHLCLRPLCVRPLHMEAVTHLENIRRGKQGELIRSTNHPLALHLFDREVSIDEFARSVFVSPGLIAKMIRGYRPADPDTVYRVGGAIGLSWEEADVAFPRSQAKADAHREAA